MALFKKNKKTDTEEKNSSSSNEAVSSLLKRVRELEIKANA